MIQAFITGHRSALFFMKTTHQSQHQSACFLSVILLYFTVLLSALFLCCLSALHDVLTFEKMKGTLHSSFEDKQSRVGAGGPMVINLADNMTVAGSFLKQRVKVTTITHLCSQG